MFDGLCLCVTPRAHRRGLAPLTGHCLDWDFPGCDFPKQHVKFVRARRLPAAFKFLPTSFTCEEATISRPSTSHLGQLGASVPNPLGSPQIPAFEVGFCG